MGRLYGWLLLSTMQLLIVITTWNYKGEHLEVLAVILILIIFSFPYNVAKTIQAAKRLKVD